MNLDWLYRLGSWNPQLVRELKGRLTPRSLNLTIFASLAVQALALFFHSTSLPTQYHTMNQYCTGKPQYEYSTPPCIKDVLGNPIVDWALWWSNLHQFLSWTLPFLMLLGGVYLLISDLGKEEKRGTLNFIRLSPQTSESILLGKVLGVPVVPYLALALTVPLHLWSAIAGQVNLFQVLGVYVVTVGVCTCFFVASLLYAFMGGFQGWVGALAVWFGYMPIVTIFMALSRSGDSTFVNRYPFLNQLAALAFVMITLAVAAFWLWTAVNRRFRNPNAGLLSKFQSYCATASFGVWLMFFTLRNRQVYESLLVDLTMMSVVMLFWMLVMIAAITPHRQTMLDWARYHHQTDPTNHTVRRSRLLTDLLLGERSPALLAIAINTAIFAVIGLVRIGLEQEMSIEDRGAALIGMGFAVMYVLICAAIAQLVLMAKSSKRASWAVGMILAFTFIPPALLGVMRISPTEFPIVWMLTPAAMFAAASNVASLSTVLCGFLAQITALGFLTRRLTGQLQQAGESEMKALMAADRTGASI
jgi:hypothetical protein